jgi:hypothetical protein
MIEADYKYFGVKAIEEAQDNEVANIRRAVKKNEVIIKRRNKFSSRSPSPSPMNRGSNYVHNHDSPLKAVPHSSSS